MTQEDKELLLKDLSARSPYKVMCQVSFDEEDVHIELLESVRPFMSFNQITTSGSVVSIDCVKPYLRPMSSMTEEERADMGAAIEKDCISPYGEIKSSGVDNLLLCTVKGSSNLIDWLNKKMFDYRTDDKGKTMIEKGLALEALEGMYN